MAFHLSRKEFAGATTVSTRTIFASISREGWGGVPDGAPVSGPESWVEGFTDCFETSGWDRPDISASGTERKEQKRPRKCQSWLRPCHSAACQSAAPRWSRILAA